MPLRWRMTLSILALIAGLLLLLGLYEYYGLRAFVLDSVAVRMRAQAKPIIDAALLGRAVDEQELRRLANRLATDLTSAETGALVVDRTGQVIGRHLSTIGEPAPPELPRAWYAPALSGEKEQNYLVTGPDGRPTLVALVPIPPRATPLGVIVLSTPLNEQLALLRRQSLSTALASAVVLVLAALLVFVTVRVHLRPLDRMVSVAQQIAQGNWSARMRLPHGRTEVGLLAQAFDEMVDRLQSAFEAQAQSEARLRRFLADVSHELRTPLTALGGYADLLLNGVAGDLGAGRPLVQAMRREISRTGRLVRDLLLLARSDRAATFDLQRIDLAVLCHDLAEQFRLLLAGRSLETALTPRVWVRADVDRLEQVLINLFDNALRHTPPGTRIELILTAADGMACLTLRDNGPGIDPELLPHLFERFVRGHHPTRGAGLGLAIVQAIVQAHGGSICATNRPQGGACFEIRLPLDRSA